MNFILAFIVPICANAAVSCPLDHPDQDIKRIFRESTGYRARELIPFRHGAKGLVKKLENEMTGPLDEEFETKDTPYTFYAVYKDKEQIGLILGTIARGVDGPMQVFVAYRKNGTIFDVFVQKISSPDATAFRSKYYREQFQKFGTANVLDEPYAKPPVRSPSNQTIKDHHSFVRTVRFNILLVKYLYNGFKE